MELKLETESVSIKLTTKDDKVDFKALVKVYELVTGDELEINETEPSHPEPKSSKPATDRGGVNTITDDLTPDSTPGWHEPSEDEHKCDIESSDVFKAYMSNVEPEPYYDFAKPKPTSGVKVTLDNGNVIYDERRYSTISGLNLCGAFLHLEKHIIDTNHIVSIEKVEEDN